MDASVVLAETIDKAIDDILDHKGWTVLTRLSEALGRVCGESGMQSASEHVSLSYEHRSGGCVHYATIKDGVLTYGRKGG